MLTLAQAVAAKGDPKKLIANLQRSLKNRARSTARDYVFSRRNATLWKIRHDPEYQMKIAMLEVAAETNDTARYVAAWCQLNHLKH